jgi:hypothetical protein
VEGSAHGVTAPQLEAQRLRGRAERAFTEVQRVDTKATALCGVAGGLLAIAVAVLSGVHVMLPALLVSLILMCSLLIAAVGAALLALRPVVPKTGLSAELVGEADLQRSSVPWAALGSVEQYLEARQLQVLARLADKKLRSVRLAVDLVLAALFVAGMGLLSFLAIN